MKYVSTIALLGVLNLTAGSALAEDSSDPIKIVTNDRTSQVVLSNVVGQVLESQGDHVEYKPSDAQLQFTAIASNDMDFQVEVWEGSMAESFDKSLKAGAIDYGSHQAVTREDWWYPSYRLQKLLRKTIVFITHDFDEAIRLGDRIGIMKDGRLVQLATPEVMVSSPADDYVREFTRNAPRDRVLTVGSIASPVPAPLNGVNILASAKIGEAAPIVLASEKPIAVIDSAGRSIGAIDRTAMIRALYPDERA